MGISAYVPPGSVSEDVANIVSSTRVDFDGGDGWTTDDGPLHVHMRLTQSVAGLPSFRFRNAGGAFGSVHHYFGRGQTTGGTFDLTGVNAASIPLMAGASLIGLQVSVEIIVASPYVASLLSGLCWVYSAGEAIVNPLNIQGRVQSGTPVLITGLEVVTSAGTVSIDTVEAFRV